MQILYVELQILRVTFLSSYYQSNCGGASTGECQACVGNCPAGYESNGCEIDGIDQAEYCVPCEWVNTKTGMGPGCVRSANVMIVLCWFTLHLIDVSVRGVIVKMGENHSVKVCMMWRNVRHV